MASTSRANSSAAWMRRSRRASSRASVPSGTPAAGQLPPADRCRPTPPAHRPRCAGGVPPTTASANVASASANSQASNSAAGWIRPTSGALRMAVTRPRAGKRPAGHRPARDNAGQGGATAPAPLVVLGKDRRARSSSGVRATTVARRLLPEAEKPQVDELIRPMVALAGPGARAGAPRVHGPRRVGRRDDPDPGPGRPAHRPSRRASAHGASERMIRAPRPRVTKLNAQLMSTSRRFWKPTR